MSFLGADRADETSAPLGVRQPRDLV